MNTNRIIKIRVCLILALVVLGTVPALMAGGPKDPPPKITSVGMNLDVFPCEMDIFGDEFGDATPTVILDGSFLSVSGHTRNHIIATFPCRAPGDYELVVEKGVHPKISSDKISLTIGAVGPTGPTGPEGPPGTGPKNQSCPPGEFVTGFDSNGDLICSVSVSAQCDQPYMSLDDPNRLSSVSGPLNSGTCDQNGYPSNPDWAGAGWYRLEAGGNGRMPESAPPELSCGTDAPGWLNGFHPAVVDGVVSRKVCFSFFGDTCTWEATVNVVNCHTHFLYEFPVTPSCLLRYCEED